MSLGGGDHQVILRRIRHGFIICDDTELCDKIIGQDVENEQRRRALAKSKSANIDKIDLLTLLRTEPDFILDELSHSPEWTAHNVQVRRVRCETLGRLDEIKTENEAKRKVEIISWQKPSKAQLNRRTSDESINDDENDRSSSSLFQRRSEPMFPLVRKSPLTALIQSTGKNLNPFSSYANFDGSSNVGPKPMKKITIHFPFNKQKMLIVVAPQATVEQTIGYICYKYTAENREPHLTLKEPSKYSLHIADDDGEAEDDFPPLIQTNYFSNYDFPHLTLVPSKSFQEESTDSSSIENQPIKDSNDDGSSMIDSSCSATPPPSDEQKSMSSVEKSNETREPVAASALAKNSTDENDPINQYYLIYESLNNKSYGFEYFPKSGNSKHVKVQIDLNGEQMRIEVTDKSSKLSWQTMRVNTQHLVDCTLMNKESIARKERARLHLKFETKQETDGSRIFQEFEFESNFELAEQFQDQILNIIKFRNPQARELNDQQNRKEKVQQNQRSSSSKKKRSFFSLIGASGSSGKS